MDRRACRWVAIAAAGLFLTACPSSPTPPAVLDVTIDQPSHAVGIGHVEHLTATVTVVGGADQTVTWTSSAPGVARVVDLDARSAELVALAEGAADVTATSAFDASRHDTITVTVEGPAGEVVAVEIDQFGHTVWVGQPETFSATVTVTGGADPTIEWTNSNAEAAAISPIDDHSVTFTPLAPGDTILTAVSVADETKRDHVALTVAQHAAEVLSVTIDQGDLTLPVGATELVSATVLVSGGADPTVAWESSAPGVATVADLGDGLANVAAIGAGSAEITAVSVADPARFDAITVTVASASPWTPDWVWSQGYGYGQDVAVGPDDRIAVVGTVSEATPLPGQAPLGGFDAFVVVLDPDGDVVWLRQFGTAGEDAANAVAFDGAGRVHVAGTSTGLGLFATGDTDLFVEVFESDGEGAGGTAFGSDGFDELSDLVVQDVAGPSTATTVVGSFGGTRPGSVPVGGRDAFAMRLDGNLAEVWVKVFGTSGADAARGAALDPEGNLWIVGDVGGALVPGEHVGGNDAFALRLAPDGATDTAVQFGTPGWDFAFGVASDPFGNATVVGGTAGALFGAASAGSTDAFAASLDGSGTLRWADQFGTGADDQALGVGITPDGATTLVVGTTEGAFPGNVYVDAGDAFVRAYDTSTYDPHGRPVWTRQTGSIDEDDFSSVATDSAGNAIVAGYVSYAAYVVKLVP